jgi:hypothetical protein
LPRLPEFLARTAAIEIRGPLFGNFVFLGQWLLNAYAPWPLQVYFVLIALIGLGIYALRRWDRALYLILPFLLMLAHMAVSPHKVFCARYVIVMLVPLFFFTSITLTWGVEAIISSVLYGKFAEYVFCSSRRPRRHELALPARTPVTTGVSRLVRDSNFVSELSSSPLKNSPDAEAGGLADRVKGVLIMGLMLIPLLLCFYMSLAAYYSKERYPIRPAAEFIAKHANGTEPVYFGGFGADKFSFYAPNLLVLKGYEELKERLDEGHPFWLVYWFPSYVDGMPTEIRRQLEQRGKLRFRHTGYQLSYSEHDYESFCWEVSR